MKNKLYYWDGSSDMIVRYVGAQDDPCDLVRWFRIIQCYQDKLGHCDLHKAEIYIKWSYILCY